MIKAQRFFPFKPAHPGEHLREDVLPDLNMSAAQFARHLGVSRQAVSQLLQEKRGVSTDMAIRLGAALGNGARFWLALQMNYDLWMAEHTPCDVKRLEWKADDAA